MRIVSISILISAIYLLSACLGVEKVTLGDGADAKIIKVKKGKPALTYKKGDLLSNNQWAGNEGLNVEYQKNQLVIDASSVKGGVIYSKTINYDFRGGLAVRIKARAEGGSPKLRFQLTDAFGLVANGKTLDEKIMEEDEVRNYYFDLNGAFIQSYPEVKEVNGAYINSIKLLIDPEGGIFSGKVIIEEIKVIMSSEVIRKKKLCPIGTPGGLITDFSEGITDWKGNSAYELSNEGNLLKLVANQVGPKYESIKRDIPTINFKNHTKLKARIKLEGDSDMAIRVDLIDFLGNVTNKRPIYLRIYPSSDYQEVILDFKNRFNQSYPKQIEVDPTRIVKIKLMLNPGLMPYSGTVLVDKLEAIN